jgi:hypothetical protein
MLIRYIEEGRSGYTPSSLKHKILRKSGLFGIALCLSCVTMKFKQKRNAYVYRWLGWEYGSFTEQTERNAINYLILSALREGLLKKHENKNFLSLFEEKSGQMAFQF